MITLGHRADIRALSMLWALHRRVDMRSALKTQLYDRLFRAAWTQPATTARPLGKAVAVHARMYTNCGTANTFRAQLYNLAYENAGPIFLAALAPQLLRRHPKRAWLA